MSYEETPNGLELCCPAAQAQLHSRAKWLAGNGPHRFRPPAGSASASCWAATVSLGSGSFDAAKDRANGVDHHLGFRLLDKMVACGGVDEGTAGRESGQVRLQVPPKGS